MAKINRRHCDQCGAFYAHRGIRFCSRSCRTTWSNLHDNPAKRADVRAKIGAARAGRPTTLGRAMPSEQRASISASLTGRTLTPEHRAAISKSSPRVGPTHGQLKGPAHPLWKGGHGPARAADYSRPEYKQFRAAVVERDNWTCQDCGKRGGRLGVHHIKSWAEHPDLRYDVSNGTTLCRPCHNTTKRGPRPTNAGPRTRAALRLGQT